MAISRLTAQDSNGTSTTATVSAVYASTPTQNNLLIADVYYNTNATGTAIPGWTLEKEVAAGAAANGTIGTYSKLAGAGESQTVTASVTGATVMRIQTYEYTGIATASYEDGTGVSNTGGTTAMTSLAAGSAALATTNANDLLHAAWGFNGATSAWSVDSSFTLLQTNGRMVSADRIVAATGSYNTTGSWTSTNRVGAVLTAYKAAATGVVVIPGTATLALTTFVPTVNITNNQVVIPPTATLALTTFTPTVIATNNQVVIPGTASLTLTPFVPTIVVGSSGSAVVVIPGTASLTLTPYAPVVFTNVRPRKYYIDSDGNIYWVVNQTLALVEPI